MKMRLPDFRETFGTFDDIGPAMALQPDAAPEYAALNTINQVLKGTFLHRFPDLIKHARIAAKVASDIGPLAGEFVRGSSLLTVEESEKQYALLFEQGVARARNFMDNNPDALVCYSVTLPMNDNLNLLGKISATPNRWGAPDEVAMYTVDDVLIPPHQRNELGFRRGHLNDEARLALQAVTARVHPIAHTGMAS